MNAMRSNISGKTASPIHRIREVLEKSRRVLVVSHTEPDGDALGTQLAMGQYLKDSGKEVFLVRDSEIPGKYRFIPGIESILPASSLGDDLNIDTALILECPVLRRAGSAVRFFKHGVKTVSIDHHRDCDKHSDVNWIDVGSSSVGEMAFEYLKAVGYDISPDVAVQLYTAILTDTGRFRYESTSPRTMAIGGELIRLGANPREVCNHIYYDMPRSTMLLTAKVLGSMEYHQDGRICIMALTKEMLAASGAKSHESDGLVDFTLYTSGVMTGALLKEVHDKSTKVSLRSGNGVNVAQVAAAFGGGGHFNAAGCELKMPLAEAKETIIKMLKEADVKGK